VVSSLNQALASFSIIELTLSQLVSAPTSNIPEGIRVWLGHIWSSHTLDSHVKSHGLVDARGITSYQS